MSAELFVPIKFNTSVQLKPSELGPNIQEIINSKLKANLENMCTKHGYIKHNSIKIIKRSIGQIIVPHFNGNVNFDLQCVAEICNPAQGSIIKCKVKAKNSLGLLAEGFYDNLPILQIIVPKISAGIQSEINIDNVKIGDEINIEVCGKKFLLYDKHISIIGKAIKDKAEKIENIVDDISESDDEKPIDDIENIQGIDDVKEIEFDEEDDGRENNTEVNDDEDEEEDDAEEEEEELDDDLSVGGYEDGNDIIGGDEYESELDD